MLRDGTQILGRGLDRFAFQPWGVAGGHPGQPAQVILNRGIAREQPLGKIDVVNAQAGDTLTFITPGGAGWGNPLQRDAQAVVQDVAAGLVSALAAERDYGVCFGADGALDLAATSALRDRRSAQPLHSGHDRLRDTWEALFDDQSMNTLVAAILRAPESVRTGLRAGVFARVLPQLPVQGALAVLADDFHLASARQSLAAELQQLVRHYPLP